MKFRWSFFRIGVFIIPFLLSLHFGFAQNQILSHIPPPNGIIGQDLILSASTLENSDQLDATLYYRVVNLIKKSPSRKKALTGKRLFLVLDSLKMAWNMWLLFSFGMEELHHSQR